MRFFKGDDIMFKNTQAFKLISIAERIPIKNRIKNILLFIFKYTKYEILYNIRIRKNISSTKKMKLFEELFKEYFYLYNTLKSLDISYNKNNMIYTVINNRIDVIITHKNKSDSIRLYVTYDLVSGFFTLYEIYNDKNINIDERNLKIKEINNIAFLTLKLLINNILYMMIEVFKYYKDTF